MVSFIDENKDFVLKLKINLENDKTQIRRVCLPRIADEHGNVSYEELVGLVLVFTLPEEVDDAGVTAGNNKYTVSLSYYDKEKDLITVASTVELMDAINLFAGQKFMRISTCVLNKISYSAAAAAYNQDPSTDGSSTVDRGTSTIDRNGDPPTPPIQVVLESFVSILTNAVQEVKGLATSDVPVPRRTSNSNRNNSRTEGGPKKNTTQNATPPSAPVKSTNTKANNGDMSKKGQKATKKLVSSRAYASRPGTKEREVTTSKFVIALNTKKEVHSESGDNTLKEKEKSEEEVKPFIHGRHTCDACLTTPIVGKRFHSMNLPDYDLCNKCCNNYSGNEIKFESIELDRDIPHQTRWQNRYRRQFMLMQNRGRSGRSGGEKSNCCPNSAIYNIKPSPQTVRSPSKEIRYVPSLTNLPPPICNDTDAITNTSTLCRVRSVATDSDSSNEQFDNALKEAIRRSLDDIVPKEASSTKSDRVKEEKIEEEDISKDLPKCNKKKDIFKSTISDKDISDDSFSEPPLAAGVQGDLPDFGISLNVSDDQRCGTNHAKDDIPCSVEIMEHDKVNEDHICNDLTMKYTSKTLDKLKVVETLENSMDTDSVDSRKLLSEGQESSTIPPSPKGLIVKAADCKPSTLKDESFSSDAVGNGDVAEVMGKTLDMVAGVISDMLSESNYLEAPTIVENSNETTNENEMGDLKPAAVDENNEEITIENRRGELIVNSNDEIVMKSGDDEEDDDSEWSVVKSFVSGRSSESGQIAIAAKMLGSALFNSDIKTPSKENSYDFMGSDSSFSIPSSVPTDIDTQHSRVTAPNQTSCWAKELDILHELGFKNDANCIAILERLEESCGDVGTYSAKFGGSIPTNIDQVVNELLEMNE